ncbi:hypothetical protein ACIODW_02505 [Streptomyces sp. NPDC087897]
MRPRTGPFGTGEFVVAAERTAFVAGFAQRGLAEVGKLLALSVAATTA